MVDNLNSSLEFEEFIKKKTDRELLAWVAQRIYEREISCQVHLRLTKKHEDILFMMGAGDPDQLRATLAQLKGNGGKMKGVSVLTTSAVGIVLLIVYVIGKLEGWWS